MCYWPMGFGSDRQRRVMQKVEVKQLVQLLDRRQSARVVALSLASAATEGLGLILLVPMLQALTGGRGELSWLGSLSAWTGITITTTTLLGVFVLLVFLRGILNLARQLAAQDLQASLVDRLRTRAWNALLHCEWRVLSQMRQSESASLLISSVDMVGYGVSQVVGSVVACVTLLGLAVAALVISPGITVLAIVGGGLVMLAYRPLRRRARALGEAHNEAYSDIHAEIGEGLAALRIVKTFGVEVSFSERLRGHFVALRAAQRSFIRDVGAGQILLQGGGACLLAIIVGLAVTLWNADLAAVLPMVALFGRALPLLDALQQASQNAAHALPAFGRAVALLDEAEAGREPDQPAGVPPPKALHSIRLEGVSVSHAGRLDPVLDHVSIELRPGTIVAVVGPSGAGKSTAADVLSGLITPDEGRLLIDGIALDSGMRRAWRGQVAYVQQDAVLFTGSVRENLLISRPDATAADMRRALQRASADFVERLPAGLDTPLGDRGMQLSGGERQRIAVARALLRKPRLLVLDEAASALDSGNEAAIADAVRAMRGELAILIIGHRGSLAEIADQVVRLEHGRVVG